jgi:hypothetical protein
VRPSPNRRVCVRARQVLTLDTLRSAQHSLGKGHFGLFDGDTSTVFFEVRAVSCARRRCSEDSARHACSCPGPARQRFVLLQAGRAAVRLALTGHVQQRQRTCTESVNVASGSCVRHGVESGASGSVLG